MAIRGLSFDVKVTLEIHPERVAQTLQQPSGPLSRGVQIVAGRVLQSAASKVGRNTGLRYSGHHIRKHLADSGEIIQASRGAAWIVRFDNEIALVHHDGSVAHSIGAPGKRLYNPRDPARSQGGSFSARNTVQHPGTKPNPYLTDAAREAGLVASGALLRGTQLTPIVRVAPSGFV